MGLLLRERACLCNTDASSFFFGAGGDFPSRSGLLLIAILILPSVLLSGVPNTMNVLTSFPLLVISVIGFVLCLHDHCLGISVKGEIWGWTFFYAGVVGLAFWSAYYHFKPDDARVVWERLPLSFSVALRILLWLFMVVWQASTGFSWKTKFMLSNGGDKHTVHTTNRRQCSFNIYSTVGIICILFFIGCAFVVTDYKMKIPRWGTISFMQTSVSNKCKDQGKPLGNESLPRGIVSQTSSLEMQTLFGSQETKINPNTSKNLLAMAVGIKQKEIVDQIVRKFISNDFSVMLFHYDGIVDEWRDLQWCDSALHVSAINQTKWWFAKRFLHPDIVAEYSYIFLWDEDLGLEHFHPRRYLQIIQEEGLEISQPALDITDRLKVHHQITARQRRNKVHRRYYKLTGGGRCYGNSTGPRCTGWVEMMAPVFSRAAWRCTWYMIQNDLIYAWGLDFKLGYCAQGERTKKVGVVDAEYIDHKAIPSLGGLDLHKVSSASPSHKDDRLNVRIRSYAELKIFKERWKIAVEEDECWIDPYPEKIK